MKIIVLGAGQVGATLASALVGESHDVTIVDNDEEKLAQLQDTLDLRTVTGHCSYPNILRQAGCEQADMIIAVTDSDESNMIACQVAYSLFDVPRKIARIRSQHYMVRQDLFDKDHLPIDVFISPEQLVTSYVRQLLSCPGALQVLEFCDGAVKLVGVKPYYGGVLLGKPLHRLPELLQDIPMRVVAIYRNEHSIEIDENTVIEVGDEVFFVAPTKYIASIVAKLRRVTEPYKRIMIAGGGNIGADLARSLEREYSVKLIDHDKSRCAWLAERLENTTVLHGEVADQELLKNESIEHVDVFCAVTSDDEANIIACLQAKRLGVKQVMALITRPAYIDLIEGGSINIAISPQQATVSSILAQLRKGDVVSVHSLRHGAAEVIELIAHGDLETSSVVGKAVGKLKLPDQAIIGAIVRGDKVLMPNEETVIETEDHVVIFLTNKKQTRDVEKLFEVNATFF